MPPVSPRRLILLGLVVGTAAVAVAGPLPSLHVSRPTAFPDLDAACAEGHPYFVTTCLPAGEQLGMQASVVMFRDTPADVPQYTLAKMQQVGSVWGLAYSHREQALYVGAFRKRQLALGPDGSGAIYRIDLETGKTRLFVDVPDMGPVIPAIVGDDRAGIAAADKTALGDIDLSADGSELFVMNLFDRRIYRFAVPSGTLLGSFPHGAATLFWGRDARPFGLTVHGGRLFHGVVGSAQSSHAQAQLQAYVFSSLDDGSDMRLATSFSLDYDRGKRQNLFGNCAACINMSPSWRWQPWQDSVPPLARAAQWDRLVVLAQPMPILSDLEILDDGRMAIALRDRLGDMSYTDFVLTRPTGPYGPGLFTFAGDILAGVPRGDTWDVATKPEFFDDGVSDSDESGLGSIALAGPNQLVSTNHYRVRQNSAQPAVFWYDTTSGQRTGIEGVCKPDAKYPPPWAMRPGDISVDLLAGLTVPHAEAHNEGLRWMLLDTLGDLQALCAPAVPSPTPSPVEPSPTATSTATSTDTATPTAWPSPTVTPSATATPRPLPLYLPVVMSESCNPATQRADVALVIDASSSMLERTSAGRTKISAAISAAQAFLDTLHPELGDQAAVVWFNDHAVVEQSLTSDRNALVAALNRILTHQYTRIDLGIHAAAGELVSARHRTTNTPVMIVLTDGRADPVPVDVAVSEAQQAKDAGVVIFTIGLGQDLDLAALGAMASRPEYFSAAPDAEQLSDIYRRIAVTIPCPKDAFWGQR